MKYFKNANDIDYLINDIEDVAKKMDLITSEALNIFDDSIDDHYKLYSFERLHTFTDILLDYVVRISECGERLSNEYASLWKMMVTAEKELEKKEKKQCQ